MRLAWWFMCRLPAPPMPVPQLKPILYAPCRWDDVLAATKRRPLSALLTPHFGYGSAAALGQAAGKTAAQVSELPAGGWVASRVGRCAVKERRRRSCVLNPFNRSRTQAKALEEARVEVGLTLQQLVDYAFSNRVIFFNALDKYVRIV